VLDLIRKIIGGKREEATASEVGDETRTRTAACVIMLEAAHADYECTEDEISHVMETIKATFDLSHEFAEELVDLARAEREEAVDIWEFTNKVKQNYSLEERIAVMEAVWRIIYIDGHMDKHEDHFARKLTNLLGLTHKEMIDAKLRAKAVKRP
jgi:uncharacterized tellurite resistance protein B-like protein